MKRKWNQNETEFTFVFVMVCALTGLRAAGQTQESLF